MAQSQSDSKSKTTHVRIDRADKSRLREAKPDGLSWPDLMKELTDDYVQG